RAADGNAVARLRVPTDSRGPSGLCCASTPLGFSKVILHTFRKKATVEMTTSRSIYWEPGHMNSTSKIVGPIVAVILLGGAGCFLFENKIGPGQIYPPPARRETPPGPAPPPPR